MPEVAVPGDGVGVLELLTEPPLAFAKSRGEARRLIKQGAVKLDDARVDDPDLVVKVEGETILRCGKRRFAKLVVG
jgi:tyrosyl-tRNA synthetase